MMIKTVTVLVFVTVAAAQNSTGPSPIVSTQTGPILGQTAITADEGKPYYFFHGIPYAEAPVGNLRFKDTVKKQPWKGVLNATKEAPPCVQGVITVTGEEDCLFLNVYTPTLEDERLPVLVFIHGGDFIVGSATYQSLVPDRMLNRNIVVVNMQYRLGVFGFASTGDLNLPGNYGLKDQRTALEWVRDNIVNFGGDPEKVTIMGQSAGAAATHYQMLSQSSQDLFRGVILDSGDALTLWSLDIEAREKIFKIASTLGIRTNDTDKLVEQLQKADVEDLQRAAILTGLEKQLHYIFSGTTFAPVIEPYYEGALFHTSSFKTLRSGNYNKKPTLMGVNSNEVAVLQKIPLLVRLYLMKYFYNPSTLTPIDLTSDPAKREAAGQDIIKHYFGKTNPIFDVEGIIKFASDDAFNRAVSKSAQLQSRHGPVYLYKFSYEGIMSGITERYQKGVGHGEELPYMFGPMNISYPAEDLKISDRMVTLWSNFIKTGNPTPNVDPVLQNVTWLPVESNSNETQFLEIDSDMYMSKDFFTESITFFDNLYAKYSTQEFDTY